MSDSDARPRYAAHRRVLSRADSSAIGAPCVLALRSPIAPARRASFWFGLLVGFVRFGLGIAPAAMRAGGRGCVVLALAGLRSPRLLLGRFLFGVIVAVRFSDELSHGHGDTRGAGNHTAQVHVQDLRWPVLVWPRWPRLLPTRRGSLRRRATACASKRKRSHSPIRS